MRDISKYTTDYLNLGFESYQVTYRRKKIIEEMKKYRHTRILEIGCGMEPLFKYLDDDFTRYTVVEPSVQFYENACDEAKFKENIRCINDYFNVEIGIENDSFDFIICSGLLHEVENPMDMLKNIYAMCNAETVVHINVPNAYSLHRLLAKEMGLIKEVYDFSERNTLYQQHNVYDMELLKKIAIEAGFEVINAGSYFIKPFTHKQMHRMLEEKIIDEKALDGFYEMERYLPGLGSEIFINVKKSGK